MTENFKVLSDDEFDQLKDAISLITVYIAGADGTIDDDELEWAEKVTEIRSYNTPGDLKMFYEEVGKDFQERLDKYVAQLSDKDERNAFVTEKLTALNPVLAKLPTQIGAEMYKSYRTFATHVAKASGGFLGFFSISAEEKAILDLNMLEPIHWEPNMDAPTEHE